MAKAEAKPIDRRRSFWIGAFAVVPPVLILALATIGCALPGGSPLALAAFIGFGLTMLLWFQAVRRVDRGWPRLWLGFLAVSFTVSLTLAWFWAGMWASGAPL